MAASLACLQLLEKENAVETMRQRGQLLMDGLVAVGAKHGYTILTSGPPAIPYPYFADDADFRRQQRFCAEVTARGAFFHPHHNWFLSTAHTEADIAETVQIAEESFAVLKEAEAGGK